MLVVDEELSLTSSPHSVTDIFKREAIDEARRAARVGVAQGAAQRTRAMRALWDQVEQECIHGDGFVDMSNAIRSTAKIEQLPSRYFKSLEAMRYGSVTVLGRVARQADTLARTASPNRCTTSSSAAALRAPSSASWSSSTTPFPTSLSAKPSRWGARRRWPSTCKTCSSRALSAANRFYRGTLPLAHGAILS